MHAVPSTPTGGRVGGVLKVAAIVLVVLVLLLGLPLGVPMSGSAMCPDCNHSITCGVTCAAVLASMFLVVGFGSVGVVLVRSRRPLLLVVPVLDRPPRSS